jgi:anti-sigma-K factor RskA
MTAQEYIESGILELYVYGSLSEAENNEVAAAIAKYPEVKAEVEKIETTLKTLAEHTAPPVSEKVWNTINANLFGTKVRALQPSWTVYIGWAASVLLLVGMFWLFNQNNQLKNNLVETQNENQQLIEQIISTEESLAETESLLNILRDKNIKAVNLPGHAPVAPEAFAKVFYNQSTQTVHLDARGLPEPPEGMVYQVWSLKMDPLTPTSIGLLDDFAAVDNKVFVLQNIPESEGFGITLEPAGGSKTPTLEQLYTMGVI